MTRGNRIVSLLALLGLLTAGFGEVAQSQDTTVDRQRYTISGMTGVVGATLQGLPGHVVTDENGVYSAEVESGWSGHIVPQKLGYAFTPPQRIYDRVSEHLANQDYVASLICFNISGNAGVPGVVLQGLPGGPIVTGEDGSYRATVEYGWSGRIKPEKEGYVFEPAERMYTEVRGNLPGQDYRARIVMITISDALRFGREPIQGVEVTARPGDFKTVTDADGRYSLKVPYGWSGRLTFSKEGFDIRGTADYHNITSDIVKGKGVPAPGDWPPPPSRSSGLPQATRQIGASDVLVIPTTETASETIAETREDLRVMLHILREKLSEPRMILGVLRDYGGFFDADRRVEALYLQGTAVVFAIEVDFPYSFPTQRPSESPSEAVDPVWERARQRLYSPAGARTFAQPGRTQEMSFEQFQEELLRSLRHAANVRHIDPNELVILTIVAQNEEAGLPGSAVSGGAVSGRTGTTQTVGAAGSTHGSAVSRRTGTTPVLDPYGKPRVDALGNPVMRPGPTPGTTVLTMQARKADVDAFARGELDFEQFRAKVRTFAY